MGFFGNSGALEKIDRDIAAIADGSADLSYSVGNVGSDRGRPYFRATSTAFSVASAASFRTLANAASALPPMRPG